jgi:hypothetical protein
MSTRPGLDLGDAVGIGRGLGFLHQSGALEVGAQHDFDQRRLFGRRFLRDLADAGVLRDRDVTGFARHLAGDDPEQRRLSGAVRPHKPGLDARGQRQRGIVDQ